MYVPPLCSPAAFVPPRYIMTLLQLPRMLRILLFMPQFTTLKNFFAKHRQKQVNESMYRMGIIFFFIILGNTFLACFYYSIGFVGEDDHTCDDVTWIRGDPLLFPTEEYCAQRATLISNSTLSPPNYTLPLSLCEDPTNSTTLSPSLEALLSPFYTPACGSNQTYGRFIRALYFMLQTLFTIGYGDNVIPVNTTERMFACVFMMVGTFIYGLVIANMTSVLANSDVLQMRFRQEMDGMNAYMDMRDVPEGLRQRIKIYFDYVFIKQYGMLEEKVLASLPNVVRNDLQRDAMKLFDKVGFFACRDFKFKSAVARRLVIR